MVVTVWALNNLRGDHGLFETFEDLGKGSVKELSSKVVKFSIVSILFVT